LDWPPVIWQGLWSII